METRCTCGEGHATFGACLRNKSISVGYCRSVSGYDASKFKAHDRELDYYESARRQGVQPASTRTPDIDVAMRVSDATGEAFDAGKTGVSLDA